MKEDSPATTTTSSSEADDEQEEEEQGERASDVEDTPSKPTGRPQRLKFNVKIPTLSAQSPNNIPRPKKHSSFREWVEITDPFDTPGEGGMTDKQVVQQASIRDRIHKASRPGGPLDPQSCTALMPESEDEPDKQYAHHDRLLKHFENFRRLLERERNRHRNEARKLANDCLARWKELQPERPETDEEFQRRQYEAVMRQCCLDIDSKFENLRSEVLHWKIDRVQEEIEIERRQNLTRTIEESEKVLNAARDAPRQGSSSEGQSNDSNKPSREENMSSDSGSEEADGQMDVDDDRLSESELRRKYNNIGSQSLDTPVTDGPIPDAPSGTGGEDTLQNGDTNLNRKSHTRTRASASQAQLDEASDALLDESDESVDMNTDVGSDESHSGSEDTSENGDASFDGENGLSALYSKADLTLLSRPGPARPLGGYDAEMVDAADDVPGTSLVKQEANGEPTVNGFVDAHYKPEIYGPQTPNSLPKKQLGSNTITSPVESTDGRNGVLSQIYSAPLRDVQEDESEEEPDEVSLIPDGIPDVVQEQTPSASNSESTAIEPNAKVVPQSPSDEDKRLPQTKDDQLPQANGTDPEDPTPSENLETAENSDFDFQGDEVTVATNVSSDSAHEKAASMHEESASMPDAPSALQNIKTPIPSLLRGSLREYQHYGVDWLAGLYASGNGAGGILADEMGLGKTIQTIALLAHLAEQHQQWGPHLVIVPSSVLMNWEMEFKKFLPGFKILTYYGTASERQEKRKGWSNDDKWNVVIAPYSVVHTDQFSFKRRKWHYMVLDEAHNIKNWQSQKWQTLLTFNSQCRLLLTGTPLQNNISELWSLLFFLTPRDKLTGLPAFAGLDEFKEWFKKPVNQILEQGKEFIDAAGQASVRQLHSVLRPYLLRRLKADVEKQMPSKYEHVIYCKLSKRQRQLYDGYMSRTETKASLASGSYISIINCLMQLRKVCNHPDLFETRPIVTSFAMPKSAVADFEIKELLVRRRLLQDEDYQTVNLNVINMLPSANGPMSALDTIQKSRLGALGRLRQLVDRQCPFVLLNMDFDGSNSRATLRWMENKGRFWATEDLRHRAYLTSLRSQRRPLMNCSLIGKSQVNIKRLPNSPQPERRAQWVDWFNSLSPVMSDLVKSLASRSELMKMSIEKFSCVTPAVVAPRMSEIALSRPGIEVIQETQKAQHADAFHEARMRLSIAFPDKRLLQYDCGKLQRLDILLRKLQAQGSRALIFTQMTKVLDLLEQFLNIHGHRYLRLDGSTKIDQRHILTERFNHDPRILCFILSSRSGGLGINLTGADTVIFYDLDWNPAMDKQCQDRCHRIGQTRDVHVYRLVSEHTVEVNILRKSNQKRRLDDVIIQEGDFTTDHFKQPNPIDAFTNDGDPNLDAIEVDGAAMVDRALGAGDRPALKVLEQAEEREDAAAARVAAKETNNLDDADFSGPDSPGKSGQVSTKNSRPQTPNTPSADAEAKRKRSALTAAGADVTSDTYLHGTVAFRSEAAEDVFQEVEPMGVDRFILEHAMRESEELTKEEILSMAGIKTKQKKKGTEHILAKKKDY